MPRIVGGLAALVALMAGVLANVDPLDCLWRAALAFVVGLLGTEAWYVFFAARAQSLLPPREDGAEPGMGAQPAERAMGSGE
ncbi:MAG: hypothetical protein WHU10_04710 [Fimbriimonadales bacterium]